jgi:hypothetical protein
VVYEIIVIFNENSVVQCYITTIVVTALDFAHYLVRLKKSITRHFEVRFCFCPMVKYGTSSIK